MCTLLVCGWWPDLVCLAPRLSRSGEPPVSERGESRSHYGAGLHQGSRVRALEPAKVLFSPDASVWGLPASVAESFTVRHVPLYPRGFGQVPPMAWLGNFRLLGALVQSRDQFPYLGMADFRCNNLRSSPETSVWGLRRPAR
jgi:hypothetical protein